MQHAPSRTGRPVALADWIAGAWSALRFDAEREAAFLHYKAHQLATQRRLGLATAPLLWMVFLYWDYLHHSAVDHFPWIVGLRFAGGTALAVLTGLSLGPWFYREAVAQAVLFSGGLIAWLTLLAMMLITPAPGSYLDYTTGLALVMAFIFTVASFDLRRALLLAAIMLATFEAAQWWAGAHLPAGGVRPGVSFTRDYAAYSQSASFYLLAFAGMGIFVTYLLEFAVRRDFTQRCTLGEERQTVERLNAELCERIEDIERMHRALEVETRRRQVQAEQLLRLKEAQRQLAEESNRKKSTFLAAATHDLRQPLTALDAMVEALDRSLTRDDLPAAREQMVLTRRSCSAMRRTLNAVLEISRLDSGIVTPDYTSFDLRPLVEEVCGQYAPLATAKGIELRLRLPRGAAPVAVRSDSALLGRVLTNLVANAIKYTAPRPDRRDGVVVAVHRWDGRVRIDVVDTGIGIAPRDQAVIFDPFVQIGNHERDREQGLGLGLSIVTQIVALLQGHALDFASTPGRGSRFSVTAPLVADREVLAEPTAVETSEPFLNEDLCGSYLLLVEDDALVGRAMCAMLEGWGCLVEHCADLTALESFCQSAERVPDVVVTDYRLPDGKTAYDVLRAVATGFDRELPTIVLSGEIAALGEIRPQVAAALSKPAEHRALRQAILGCLR
jgi:signal transduction histidine kinase/CheY-like chemotaxis protein